MINNKKNCVLTKMGVLSWDVWSGEIHGEQRQTSPLYEIAGVLAVQLLPHLVLVHCVCVCVIVWPSVCCVDRPNRLPGFHDPSSSKTLNGLPGTFISTLDLLQTTKTKRNKKTCVYAYLIPLFHHLRPRCNHPDLAYSIREKRVGCQSLQLQSLPELQGK